MANRSDEIMTGMFRDRESAERGYECLRTRGLHGSRREPPHVGGHAEPALPEGRPEKDRARHEGRGGRGHRRRHGRRPRRAPVGLAAAGIAVPGLPIIAMGPLAAALTGAGTGGALGALIGGLVGYGIPEERAKVYEQGVREGGIVFGVTPRTPEDADYIERGWTDARGEQIYRPGAQPVAGRRI